MKNISYHFLRAEEPRNGPRRRDMMPKPNQRNTGKIVYLPRDPVTNTLNSALNTNSRP